MGKIYFVVALVAMTAGCCNCGALDAVAPVMEFLKKIPGSLSGAAQHDNSQKGDINLGGGDVFNRTSVVEKNGDDGQSKTVYENDGKVGANLLLSESLRGRHNVSGAQGISGSGEGAGDVQVDGNFEINGTAKENSDKATKGEDGSVTNVKSNGQHIGQFKFESGFTGAGKGSGSGKVEAPLPLKLASGIL